MEEEEKQLGKEQSTMYRAIAARGMHLARDRSDIAYLVKELARFSEMGWSRCGNRLAAVLFAGGRGSTFLE